MTSQRYRNYDKILSYIYYNFVIRQLKGDNKILSQNRL